MRRIILEGRVNGNRKRGRPRRQWEKDIEDVLKMSIIEVGRLANNRDEFQTAVRGATSSSLYFILFNAAFYGDHYTVKNMIKINWK